MSNTVAAPMNRFEFATTLIRAPWARRIADRSFLLALGAAILGVYLQQHGAITGSELVNLLSWTVGPWIVAEKGKDAFLGGAAIKSVPAVVEAPQVLAEPQVLADEADADTDARRLQEEAVREQESQEGTHPDL